MDFSIKWIRIALINFLVLACSGVLLRYSMNFYLPGINYKFLLHSHSHFAFVGWITSALMTLMVDYLKKRQLSSNYKRYHFWLITNSASAYGMLCTFIFQGYATFSIAFSTLSILVSWGFIYDYGKDLRRLKDQSIAAKWFNASLLLWIISSTGVFVLAYLMASHNRMPEWTSAAIYFFLHFQYNGWFLFACFGLLAATIERFDTSAIRKVQKQIYRLFTIAVFPAYFLSVLPLNLIRYDVYIAAFAAILQLYTLLFTTRLFLMIRPLCSKIISKPQQYLLLLAFLSLNLKILLQAGSAIPHLSNHAYEFRPIVIAFLHLSFLGIISFFIIAGFYEILKKDGRKLNMPGLMLFITGVVIQELVLLIQGLTSFGLPELPFAGLILLAAAGIMASGILLLCYIPRSISNPFPEINL